MDAGNENFDSDLVELSKEPFIGLVQNAISMVEIMYAEKSLFDTATYILNEEKFVKIKLVHIF